MAQLEIKKMKQGMSYSCKEKTIILNVFKYFRMQFPEKCVTEIVRRTAKATGCSEKSIFQFRKEEASAEGFREPSKTKIRKHININSRDIKYDNNVRQTIRSIIYDLKYRNIVPSLNTILKQVNADTQLPNFSLMTLRRLLFDMGFCYEKNGNKSVLVEKSEAQFNGNKDNNASSKTTHKKLSSNNAPSSNNLSVNGNINSGLNSANKIVHQQLPPPVSNNMSMPTNHVHPIINEQGHRLMQMHVPQPETHIMPPPHMHSSHGMHPMMINPRADLIPPPPPPPHHHHHHMRPPNMRDVPPWIHPSTHNMVKQQ